MKFSDVIDKINSFDNAREGWFDLQPADLAKSIMIESAELLEHFQWDMKKQINGKKITKDKVAIGDEVADIFIYLFKFCRQMDIDPVDVILDKLEKTGIKYPVWYKKNKTYLEIKNDYRNKS